MHHNLVLSGGGLKGISHLGALQRLHEIGMINLRKLRGISGSSVGAIIGVFLTLGFSIAQIYELVTQLDMSKLVDPDITLLIDELGLDNGSIIRNYIEKVLQKVTHVHQITFSQLYALTGIHLIITGTCIDEKKCVYFSHQTSPNMSVSLAVRISFSLPVLFTPVTIDGRKYIDGSCVNNLPFDPFLNDLKRTIGILLCSNTQTTSDCPEEYILSLFNLMVYMYFQKDHVHTNRTVFVFNDKSLSPFRFTIDDERKKQLFQDGIIAVDAFVKKNQ